jgi:hypothetical protein
MIDPVSLSLIIGVAVLIVDKVYNWASSIYTSKCCCGEIDRKPTREETTTNK